MADAAWHLHDPLAHGQEVHTGACNSVQQATKLNVASTNIEHSERGLCIKWLPHQGSRCEATQSVRELMPQL